MNYRRIAIVRGFCATKFASQREKFVDSFLHLTVHMVLFAAPSWSLSRQAKTYNIISSKLFSYGGGVTGGISETGRAQLRSWDFTTRFLAAMWPAPGKGWKSQEAPGSPEAG